MKNSIGLDILVIAGLLWGQAGTLAQGTTYISNLGEPTTGSLAVANDAWLSVWFRTGNSPGGYTLDSISLAIGTPSGNPSGFSVMLWDFQLDQSMATLSGVDPAAPGVFTFTAANVSLSPLTLYWFAVTAATPGAVGAFSWDHAAQRNLVPEPDRWWRSPGYQTSSDGMLWSRTNYVGNLKFAVNATAIPEPSSLALFLTGGLLAANTFIRRRRSLRCPSTRNHTCKGVLVFGSVF